MKKNVLGNSDAFLKCEGSSFPNGFWGRGLGFGKSEPSEATH